MITRSLEDELILCIYKQPNIFKFSQIVTKFRVKKREEISLSIETASMFIYINYHTYL